jgi:hypothetical protein
MRDLAAKVSSDDEYEVLMIAALLRKLLLDSPTLVSQVNRGHSVRIRFRVNEYLIPAIRPGFHVWSIEDGFAPEPGKPSPPVVIAPGAPPYPILGPVEVPIKQLLQKRVFIWEGRYVTVKDVIRHVAHFRGAVHADQPKKEQDLALQRLGERFWSRTMPGDLNLLRKIGLVVLDGLDPLRIRLLEENNDV